MPAYLRFRGSRTLAPDELKSAVQRVLAELRETASVERAVSGRLVAALHDGGFGAPREPDADGVGYRQVLELLGAALLSFAGASVEAIRGEIGRRDTTGLEILVQAVLARMAHSAELGEPGLSRGGESLAEVSTEMEPQRPGANGVSPQDAVGRDGSRGVGNVPQQYLRSLVDDEVRRRFGGFDEPRPAGFGQGSEGSARSTPQHPEPGAGGGGQDESGVTVREIARGVTVLFTREGAAAHRAPEARADLLRSFAAFLDRYYR